MSSKRKLDDIVDKEEIDKEVLQLLVDDNFFFDNRFKYDIKDEKYKDVKHLTQDFGIKILIEKKKIIILKVESSQTYNKKKESILYFHQVNIFFNRVKNVIKGFITITI